METTDHEQYVRTEQKNFIRPEEMRESMKQCILQDGLVVEMDTKMSGTRVEVEILTENSDYEDDGSVVYPIYIKQEEPHQYTSGDDESLAVEALRQLGGMYPCFNDKKISCSNCTNLFTQAEISKHQDLCIIEKLSCTTCGENFERKIDLNNHIVCHQVDRPHACRTCGNLFRSKAHLQAHMSQTHEIEKPYKCTICGADFQRPSSLSNHMKIHTYVAGRAIVHPQSNTFIPQSIGSVKRWPEMPMSEAPTILPCLSAVPNVQTVPGYDVTSIHYSSPPYTIQNDLVNITLDPQNGKIDSLSEFALIPNGDVTQFEYTQPNTITNQIGQQYSLDISPFESSDTVVKIENFTNADEDNQTNYGSINALSNNESHICNHRSVNFSQESNLMINEKTHTSKIWISPIECEYCDKQFQDANHLASHQITCAKKLMQDNNDQSVISSKWNKHSCSECGKKFTTKQKMFRHQWIHRKKTHSCEVCGAQFEKQNQLDEHRLSAHPGDSPFTCNECGKSFVSRQGLWEHGRTHAGSPAHFHCDTCSKTFSSRQGYLIHHRTHTGERPYGCKFCWKAFRDGGTLRKHERIHTGERPHVCPLCSRAFNQKVVLREHVRWVHAAAKSESYLTGPPFPCPLCGDLNQDRDELCAHIVKHSDKMIADAKAKTNNSLSKSKSAKKKLSKAGESSHEQIKLITDVGKNLEGHLINTKQGKTLLLVTTDKPIISNIEGITGREDNAPKCKSLNVIALEKKENATFFIPAQRETIVHEITTKSNNENTCSIHTSEANETIRRITNKKQTNILHLVTKQNEPLPLLAISSTEERHHFSTITEFNNTSGRPIAVNVQHSTKEKESFLDENSFQSKDVQISQYEDDRHNENKELICGICGDVFRDKNVLMDHVKIHV